MRSVDQTFHEWSSFWRNSCPNTNGCSWHSQFEAEKWGVWSLFLCKSLHYKILNWNCWLIRGRYSLSVTSKRDKSYSWFEKKKTCSRSLLQSLFTLNLTVMIAWSPSLPVFFVWREPAEKEQKMVMNYMMVWEDDVRRSTAKQLYKTTQETLTFKVPVIYDILPSFAYLEDVSLKHQEKRWLRS